MKRIVILITIVLATAGMLIADEAVLIDFSKLTADLHVRISETETEEESQRLNQNGRTIMDYGQVAGNSYSDDAKAIMKSSLAIANWDVNFSSSSRTITNVTRTFTRESRSNKFEWVMGVRVHYPLDPAYSKATIRPPFEIPAYEPRGTYNEESGQMDYETDENGEPVNGITGPSRFEADDPSNPTDPAYGVVKNVGTIRSVQVHAYGLNFPHSLSVILIDNQGNEKVCFMGYLNYDGWKDLVWNNPQYVMEVRNRDLRLYPLYPTNTPFVKFGGFRLDRDADHVGGDFIAYFKDVKIIYDKAMLDTGERDINDEGVWNIIYEREEAKKVFEMQRFGHNQVLRYLESQKKATESFDPLHGDYGFSQPEEGDAGAQDQQQ